MPDQPTVLRCSTDEQERVLAEAHRLLAEHAALATAELLDALLGALEPSAFVLVDPTADGAGELVYRFEFSQRFHELMAALRTGDRETVRAVVAKGTYHESSSQDLAVAQVAARTL